MVTKYLKSFMPGDKKTTANLILEIHNAFNTEVERLLEQAKIKHEIKTEIPDLLTKASALKRLGFGKTKEVITSKSEKERLNALKKANEDKESLIRAINYFSFKYPMYKFITEESVKFICEKYGLIYGSVEHYTGTVPDKNLKEIENSKINDKDKAYIRINTFNQATKDYVSFEKFTNNKDYSVLFSYTTAPLEIAAPKSDFDLTGLKIENYQISKAIIPDPVVMQPVFYEGKKYNLIITAWGDEASDELVKNPKHN